MVKKLDNLCKGNHIILMSIIEKQNKLLGKQKSLQEMLNTKQTKCDTFELLMCIEIGNAFRILQL